MTRDNHRRPKGEEAATGGRTAASSVPAEAPGGTFGPSLQCPDCGARSVGNSLTHDETCPVGRAIDTTMDADRVFFEEHPKATEYRRPVTQAEAVELRTSGAWPDVPGRAVGRVLVTQIEPGLRRRSFAEVFIIVLEDGAK